MYNSTLPEDAKLADKVIYNVSPLTLALATPFTFVIVTAAPLVYGVVFATVIIIGVAFDNAMTGEYNVPFGAQPILPVPSVSNT